MKRAAGAAPGEDGAEQLRRVDRALARARRENGEMREQLESHAGELDHAQRLKNVATDLKAKLANQEQENELLLVSAVNAYRAMHMSDDSEVELATISTTVNEVFDYVDAGDGALESSRHLSMLRFPPDDEECVERHSSLNSYHDKGRFVASSSEEDLAQQCTDNLEIERVASVEC